MKITVTQEHINKGHISKANSCPVALALQSAGFEAAEVHMDEDGWTSDVEVNFYIPSVDGDIKASRSVERFVYAYDNGRDVQPFSFILNI